MAACARLGFLLLARRRRLEAALELGIAARERQKIGMFRALEQQLHVGIGGELRILVTVDRAQEPAGAAIVDLLHRHRPHGYRLAAADPGAEKAGLRFLAKFPDPEA